MLDVARNAVRHRGGTGSSSLARSSSGARSRARAVARVDPDRRRPQALRQQPVPARQRSAAFAIVGTPRLTGSPARTSPTGSSASAATTGSTAAAATTASRVAPAATTSPAPSATTGSTAASARTTSTAAPAPTLSAGAGNDTINAGYGRDRVFGGAGRDFINIATAGPAGHGELRQRPGQGPHQQATSAAACSSCETRLRSSTTTTAGQRAVATATRAGLATVPPVSRREQIRMSAEEVAAFLAEERTVICATIGRDGLPHLMPLWYVVRDGELWAWTFAKSQKVRNLERDPRATLQVEAGSEYDRAARRDAEVRRDDPSRHRPTSPRSASRSSSRYAPAAGRARRRRRARWSARRRPSASALQFVERTRATWDHRKLAGGVLA